MEGYKILNNLLKVFLVLAFLGSSLMPSGCRSGDDYAVISVKYNIVLERVERWEGSEYQILEKVGDNGYQDEYILLERNPSLENILLFQFNVKDGTEYRHLISRPSLVTWITIIHHHEGYPYEGLSELDGSEKVMFFPESEIAPVQFDGLWRDGRAIVKKAKSFKNTDLILVIPIWFNQVKYEYKFIYKVNNVNLEIKGSRSWGLPI